MTENNQTISFEATIKEGIRPQVLGFAWLMELKLRKHYETRPGWNDETPGYLFRRATEEMKELEEAIYKATGARLTMNNPKARLVQEEAVDVGNFAMMIADVIDPGSLAKEAEGAALGVTIFEGKSSITNTYVAPDGTKKAEPLIAEGSKLWGGIEMDGTNLEGLLEEAGNEVAKYLFTQTNLPVLQCIEAAAIVRQTFSGGHPSEIAPRPERPNLDPSANFINPDPDKRMDWEVAELCASFIEPRKAYTATRGPRDQGRWTALAWAASVIRKAFPQR